ncbi:glycoside hydrolase family protein [Nannocystis sp. ILAH1]|uniref:glycoside hydrolase family protein n=1 Tax=Nannocystis sp. ILAH1 TaxID=2996789 RepID=UPI0022700DD3|nr:glycoside hydrolase family protein [Nannocystis sp. ILAH1]MCY0992004.1 glycoside hydrolase family protein [Nannocystis sp. ILAH1]
MTWLVGLGLALGCGATPGDGDSDGGSDGPVTASPASTTGTSAVSGTETSAASGTETGPATPTSTGEEPGTDTGNSTDSGGVDRSACKRGIAYGYHSHADLAALAPGVSWWYNWAVPPDQDVGDYASLDVEFVPMLWGGGSLDQDPPIPEGARYLLAFNEPNFGAQANLTPQEAAALWPQVEAVADAHGLEIVSPALNYCGGDCNKTDPFEWFDEFFAACPGCRVDHLAVHWYACTRDALTWYIGEMKRYDLPIWLTEFSCLDAEDKSVAVQKQYMQEALEYLEAEPAVVRYSWFSGRFDPEPNIDLLGESGQLTELGQLYVSAPASCP